MGVAGINVRGIFIAFFYENTGQRSKKLHNSLRLNENIILKSCLYCFGKASASRITNCYLMILQLHFYTISNS